jgi:hypothetical protein
MMKQLFLVVAISMAFSMASANQGVLQQDGLEGCTEMCHHLTSGPCQHPNYLDEVCAEKIVVNNSMVVCPPGLLDCGFRPTREEPSPAPSSTRTSSSTPSLSVHPLQPNQVLAMDLDERLQRERLLTRVDMPAGDYVIEMDFTFNNIVRVGSLVHITENDSNCCGWGDRIPAVWLLSSRYLFRTGLPQSGNHGFDCATGVHEGVRYNVKFIRDISEDGRVVTDVVVQDGVELGRTVAVANQDLSNKIFQDAYVYAADPWHDAAGVTLHTLKISTFPGQDNFW